MSIKNCESCGVPEGSRHKPTTEKPDFDIIEEWVMDGMAEATDGCPVEPDGRCPHGHSSWLLVLGII